MNEFIYVRWMHEAQKKQIFTNDWAKQAWTEC